MRIERIVDEIESRIKAIDLYLESHKYEDSYYSGASQALIDILDFILDDTEDIE